MGTILTDQGIMEHSVPPQSGQDAAFPSWSVRASKEKCSLRMERLPRPRSTTHEPIRVDTSIHYHQRGMVQTRTVLHDNVNNEEMFAMRMFPNIPETPEQLMEFLSRSWSSASVEVIQALSPNSREKHRPAAPAAANLGAGEHSVEAVGTKPAFSHPPSTIIASSHCTSPTHDYLILPDRSPLIHKGCSTHMDPAENILDEESASAPSKMDDLKARLSMQQSMHPESKLRHRLHKKWRSACTVPQLPRKLGRLKSLLEGVSFIRWIRDLKDTRKDEVRLQRAQVHAAISVAGVAAAIAAFAAANVNDESQHQINVAVASAAALVAAQCVEVAGMMGADHQQVSSVLGSAITAKTAGDMLTLTAAAATSLRGAATLKSRARGLKIGVPRLMETYRPLENITTCDEINVEMLMKGTELLTRVQNEKPQWKIVSVYLNKQAKVILKLRSKHFGGAFTTSKESYILEVIRDIQSCSGGYIGNGVDHLYYFGVKTFDGVIQFEFKDQFNYHLWVSSISQLLKLSNQVEGK